MANSDAATLAELKTARDAIIASIAANAGGVVMITIRGRTKQVSDPARSLVEIEKLIQTYSLKVARATRSPYRLVHIHRVGRPNRST